MSPELVKELDGTPGLAAMQDPDDAAEYPKPTQADIEGLYEFVRPGFDAFHSLIAENRDLRYQRDETPKKWKRRLQDSRRFRSKLAHNEILHVAAMICRNPPKFKVQPAGAGATARARATKQTRWLNQLLQALERKSQHPILRRVADCMAGDGLGVLEVYLARETAYDNLDTDPQDILDEKTGQMRPETADEIMQRTEDELIEAGEPFGIRWVDPLALFYDEDENGQICRALIVEQKPYKMVYSKLSNDSKAHLPKPGTPGWAPRPTGRLNEWYSETFANIAVNNARESVLTLRYYDERYYAYIVGGQLIDDVVEHKLPGCPVFLAPGITTGSPNIEEMYQGVTWGMAGMELAVNDLMTLEIDSLFTNSRQRPVIVNKSGASAPAGGKPPNAVDLSDPDKPPRLLPGEEIIDAAAGFQQRTFSPTIQQIIGLFQRSGLNPIASGESPGSDPAGYTVNSLMGAAQSQYEILLDNYGRMLAHLGDFVRLMIRDTLAERVYLSVPMADTKQGGTEWLALGPDDIDETPCIVVIDPLSDANRLALRQSLITGNKDGYVPRNQVQVVGYGAEDPDAWDDELIVEAALSSLESMLIADVQQTIQMAQQAEQAPPPGSTPTDPTLANGAAPAPVQPPEVGGAMAQASRGGGLNASRANAGQDRGYRPPGAGETP